MGAPAPSDEGQEDPDRPGSSSTLGHVHEGFRVVVLSLLLSSCRVLLPRLRRFPASEQHPSLKMKVVAAYLLALLGGNASPKAKDIEAILGSGTSNPTLPMTLTSFVFCFALFNFCQLSLWKNCIVVPFDVISLLEMGRNRRET